MPADEKTAKADGAWYIENQVNCFFDSDGRQVVDYRKINTRDYIDAVIKNGYPKIRDWIQMKKDGTVGAACANGQALLNLGIRPDRVYSASYSLPSKLRDSIIEKNDKTVRRVTNIGKDYLDSPWYTNPVEFEVPSHFFNDWPEKK